jgi:methionine-rich copper-binding protein CopC
LTVTLTNTNPANIIAFTLSSETITTIGTDANNKTATFTVQPKPELGAGTYTATVTVSGDANIQSRSFGVSFVVAATYGITLSADGADGTPIDAVHSFGTVTLPNYTQPAALSVTVTNISNQATGALTVALTNANPANIIAFTLSSETITTIGTDANNKTATFTVVPKPDLGAGTYTATVSVTGGNNINASFGVSFTVNPPPLTAVSSFANIVAHMAGNPNSAAVSYTLPGGAETYGTSSVTLTANIPKRVTIDGGGRVITGGTNSITVGAGITLTLKNIKFTNLPLIVAAGGKLVLGKEGESAGSVVVRGNAATAGITVNGGTLEMKTGALVTDNHDSGIVLEDGSTFTMTGGEISGNEVNYERGYGGGVRVKGANSVFTMGGGVIKANEVPFTSYPYGFGGGAAIVDGGTFIMTDGSILDNKSEYGGGVYMDGEDATFTMTGGSISDNGTNSGSVYGGGVYAESNGGSFTLDGGVITGNKAHIGAGVWISGEGTTFTMNSGAISGNNSNNYYSSIYISGYATAQGGGVRLSEGVSFTMNGGEISGNTTEGRGGGVYGAEDFNMNGGVIKNNTAVLDGGGVYGSSNTFNMTGGEITGNSAGNYGGGVYLYSGTLAGNPSIGTKDTARCSIWGNEPDEVYHRN